MDDTGRIVEPEEWKEATKEVGELLGYPKTAIDGFINGRDLKDEDRVKIMKRNRYYTHSIEYEEGEYRQYDRIINIAVSKYAPKTTDFMTKEKEKGGYKIFSVILWGGAKVHCFKARTIRL